MNNQCRHDGSVILRTKLAVTLGKTVKRRTRQCMECAYRWHTLELEENELKKHINNDIKLNPIHIATR